MEKIIRRVQFAPKPLPTINVAAYARVSSDKDAMLHSLSEQISYYNGYIQKHPGWKFCGVYADEAKTGTKDSRANFQRLLSDCRAGKIDLIITKSISRFARNRSIETHLQFQGQLSRFRSGPGPERSVNQMNMWPVVDMTATGRNIVRLRKQAGLTVRDLQDAFGFSNPQAIYQWQRGNTMPTVDNLVILAAILGVGIDDIIVCNDPFQAKITA